MAASGWTDRAPLGKHFGSTAGRLRGQGLQGHDGSDPHYWNIPASLTGKGETLGKPRGKAPGKPRESPLLRKRAGLCRDSNR